jgi:hypothetical protein
MPQVDFYAKNDDHGIRWGRLKYLPNGGIQWHLW